MDMGDGSSFIDEFSHSDLFGVDGDGTSGFEWADEILSSSEGGEKSNADNILETSVINNVQQTVQYSQTNQQLSSQPSSVNVQYIQSTTNTTVQQATVQQIQPQQQPAQIIPNISNLTPGGGQLIQGVNGPIFLKPLPNGQFQLAAQPQIQQIQHPQQSSSPIPIQPHPQGSPHVNILQNQNQSPIPISSPHVGSSSSPHVSRSVTPLQQTRQFQNVNMLQVPSAASQTQQQIIRNLPLTSQISNIGNLQTQQIIPSQGQVLQNQGHAAVQNQGQNYVNTQNTVIQNPNVVNVNVAHVLCPNQFQGQQGQNIQGTLIQTADGKQIIIPNSQLPAQNQIQIQNLPQVLQPQINVVPSSSAAGTTPLVQGGQVVENNAATLGGLGLIRIATSSSSSHDNKVQNVQPQQPTHFLGVNPQGQQILFQRTPTPSPNIVLRPSNIVQLPQQQNQSTNQIVPQASQATQQILLPQVQRIVTGQGQQQVKLVAPSNLQTGNLPMTLNIGGQNIILPSNFQQILQQQQQQSQSNQGPKSSNSVENVHNKSSSCVQMSTALPSSRVATPVSTLQVNSSSTMSNFPLASSLSSQVQTFLVPQITSGTANMTTVTTTVSQNRQGVAHVSMSNSPNMFQTIPSVAAASSTVVAASANQKPFLSAVSNAPKLPTTAIQLPPQVHQQVTKIQTEIRKLASLHDPTDMQKQQLIQYKEGLKQLIAKAQIKIQPSKVGIQPASSQSSTTPSFIGQPAVTQPQPSPSGHHQVVTQPTTGTLLQSQNTGNTQTPNMSGLSAQGPVSSVQSQSGVISSLGSKAAQQPVLIQTPVSTMLVTSQTGPVQGQSGSGIVQSGSTTAATPVKGLPTGVLGKVPISSNPQVAVPTQLKIANHILTLNLTPDQKEKVQGYLAKMPIEQQQQQMALFLKLQQQQKLNAQVQAQMEHQKRLQTGGQSASNIQSQVPLTVQPQLAPATSSGTVIIEQPGASPSKPNIVHRVSVAAIPKHQLIHQQLGKDQANAVHTDTKSPFQTQRDMYRRLLRYHVFQTKNPPDHLVKKDDEMFEDLSEGLVKKKDWMFEKYRSLLLEESMREQQTAEIMMIQKMLNEDLKEVLEDEKKTVKRNPEEFDPMPRKYLRLGSQSAKDLPDTKVDPHSIQIKVEKNEDASPLPVTIKKEITETESRPSTPKLKLVIKSDGQRYSSTITEEDVNDSDGTVNSEDTNFMRGISVKEEQVDPEENVPYSNDMKPFDLYSGERKSRNLSDISDDLPDNGAESDSDVTVVSDGEKVNDPIVIDDDDEGDDEDMENHGSSSDDNHEDDISSPKSISLDPVIKHEDISSDFTDLFSNKYQTGSSELSFYTKNSPKEMPSNNAFSDFPPSEHISNDFANSQGSDAQSTRTIPYSEDGNSLKDEDLNEELDYNKSTSSFAQYEPISSPEADQNESSFSNYLDSFSSSSTFNMGGIRDQNLGFSMTHRTERDSHMTNYVAESPPWTEEENENADQIKAEMESAISSILDLN